MIHFKKGLAVLIAGIIFFYGIPVHAEEPGRDTVGIQESLVSREREADRTIKETIRQLAELIQTEEVRNLLKMQDVSDILNDVVIKVLLWMIENRPVTMKILAEFGIGETDRQCIEKIWDSAERIAEASSQYSKTEQGKQLHDEFNALVSDPDFLSIMQSLEWITSSGLTPDVMKKLGETALGEIPESYEDGALTQEALSRLDPDTFTGSFIILLMDALDHSAQFHESVPRLLSNQNLWLFLSHLSAASRETDPVIRNEFLLLSSDPEIPAFMARTCDALKHFAAQLSDLSPADSGDHPEVVPQSETEAEIP